MQQKRPSVPVIIIVVLVLAFAIYYGLRSLNGNGNGQLSASGTIESVIVNISPEMSGKVLDVLVDEGQTVKTGDPLLHLDPQLLTAQRALASAQVDSAKAALASAQNNYDLTLQNALTAEKSTTSKNLHFSAPNDFTQPLWYFSQPEGIKAAQAEVDAAQKSLQDAQDNLQKVVTDLNNADFINAETRLANARAAFLVADDVKKTTDNAAEGGGVQRAGDSNYNNALDELRSAQDAYNALLNTQSATDVEDARGKVIVAQQRYDTAYARLVALQTGTQSPSVVTASKALDQAKTALAQAQANLALLDTQISKLTVNAPMDGIILTRNVEPGEIIQPGGTALSMANLNDLTITVYVPEDRINEIKLGQSAAVMIDAATGVRPTFDAKVIHISDQAEFTPRNVQTVEGRSSTVYAVKLEISDPSGVLKIGMPADVTFNK
jgi:multidrug resistance efflux pump